MKVITIKNKKSIFSIIRLQMILFLFCVFFLIMAGTSLWAAVPNPPSNLTAVALSSSEIELTWEDNSTDELAFYLEYRIGETGSYYSYIYIYLPADTTTYTHTNLEMETTYYYRIRAANSDGHSANSNEAGATTLPFSPPSDLSVAPLSSSEIKLTWTDNIVDETGFEIEYKIEETGTYTSLTYVPANTTTYTHTNLMLGVTYYYRIRSYKYGIYSPYSNEASATTPTCVEEGFYQP
jgi:hypothetical protein